MAHNLEIRNGEASFVSARVSAWHQLGTVVDHTMTAHEALKTAHLAGWNLQKTPLQTPVPGTGELINVPDRWAVTRTLEGESSVLGVVGNGYAIMQNESLTTLLDTLVDESGAHYETAGAVDGGRKVFVSMKLPGHISIGGVDPIDQYITAMTSHDGSSSTVLMVTPVRVVCQNTMNLALSQARNTFRIRHTVGAQNVVIGEARHHLDLSFKYLEEFTQTAEELVNTSMTLGKFEQIIEAEFGAEASAPVGTVTRSQNKIDQMLSLFADSKTHEDVRNTAWAGVNALTEWFDHYAPTRGDESPASVRAKNTLSNQKFKSRALELMSV